MKTNFGFSFSFSLSFSHLMTSLLTSLLSVSLISGPSLSLAAGEVVTTSKTGVAPLAKVDVATPTAIEMKMGAVKSPYKSCEGVVTVERPADISKWKEQNEFWSKYPKEGCETNCDRKVQFIPDTHFYKTFDGRPNVPNFTSTESANDFLARVGKASIDNTKAKIANYEAQQKCFGNKTDACEASSKARIAALKAQIPKFRMIVARLLEQSPKLMSIDGYVPARGEQLVNRKMKDAETSLLVPKGMPDLSSAEESALKAELDKLLAQSLKGRDADIESYIKDQKIAADQQDRIRSNLRDPKMYGPKLKEELSKKRVENTEAYVTLLKSFPELAYVNESDLTPEGMKQKLGEMIADANATMEEMTTANKPWTRGLAPGEVSSKRLIFAAHTETIENMLKKEGNGKSCAVANAVYNEIATVRTKDGLTIGGITMLAALGSGAVGFFKGKAASAATLAGLTSEAGTLTAQAVWMGRLAIASGAIGGIGNTVHELKDADETVRDAKVGVVRVEEGKEALAGKTLTTALGVLDFQGTGTLFAGAAGFAGYGLTKLGLSNILKGGGKGGAKAAEDLAAKMAAAQAGDRAAAAAVQKIGLEEGKKVVGASAASSENAAVVDALVSSGLAGTAGKPDPTVVKAVVDHLAGMQGPNKAAEQLLYRKNVTELAETVRATSGGLDAPGRRTAIANAIPEVADVVPMSAAKQILADPAWDGPAITGWAAIAAKMRTLKGSAEERFLAAWESLRVKAGLAKEKVKELIGRCRCGGFCPVAAVAVYDGQLFETTSEPVFMACAAPLSPSL